MPSALCHVLLAVIATRSHGRGILHGINQYVRQHEPWRFLSESLVLAERPNLPPNLHIDGVIGHPQIIKRLGEAVPPYVPIVNLSNIEIPPCADATVCWDCHHLAHLATDHLLEAGLEHFGYYGAADDDPLFHEYSAALRAKANTDCSLLTGYTAELRSIAESDPQSQSRLLAWLRALPKPVGILAREDVAAWQVVQTCIGHGIRVPDEVAVVAGTGDEIICEMCSPQLTAIMLSAEEQGYTAAALLDQLMAGAAPPPEPLQIAPKGIVSRESSAVLPHDDAVVRQAMCFIRMHATQPIRVEDVLEAVPISRSALERRFRRALGSTPAVEIRRLRTEKAKQLLADTELSMASVAHAAGFNTAEYMASVLRTELQMSPRAYRRHVQKTSNSV